MAEIPELNYGVTKGSINDQICELVTREDLFKNLKNYQNNSYAVPSMVDDGIYLPVKGEYNNSTLPGVYTLGNVALVEIRPEEIFRDKYIPKDAVTMTNEDDIRELIKKGDAIKKLDEPFLTSPDNITKIPVKDSDQPEMRGLKMALNAKNIDIDKYATRFGENYPNDKRQLKNSNATLKIIKRFCDNCDMEALLIFRDKGEDIPNPMNTEVVVSLTDPDFICDTDDSYNEDDED